MSNMLIKDTKVLIISLDETHHIKDGLPLYETRYTRVMSFHNGIAPVEVDNQAFFIDENNNKLFNRTFIKAYGFYENISAVKDKDGWFHIDIYGSDIYTQRYDWVGNFGESRCVVRDSNNNYFHIDTNGKRVYQQNYNYTGDFKYGIAVVVNQDGKSTHIDSEGNILHGKYFDELNIFHKGYAIAKDKNGYFHIDKKGDALYSKRYMKIEDFYNGCALATTFENNKIVLSESELTVQEITKPIIDKDKILDESFGYFKYQVLFAILKLNVLNSIKYNKGINLPSLSQKLIYRWLLVEKIIDKNNKLTNLGEIIENELKPLILYWQDLPFKTSSYMIDTLKSGNESFSQIFKKQYFDFLENSTEYSTLSKNMNSYYTVDYNHLIKHLDLSNEVVCDIGGGDGKLIELVQKFYKNIKPLVADKFIDKSKKNIEIDFFDTINIDSDIFFLSRILHDWSDEKALIILQNISKNMNASSVLYIFETIVPEELTSDKGITLSFHLLNFLGGYERTIDDFGKLLQKANLKIVEVFEEDKLISLIKVCKV